MAADTCTRWLVTTAARWIECSWERAAAVAQTAHGHGDSRTSRRLEPQDARNKRTRSGEGANQAQLAPESGRGGGPLKSRFFQGGVETVSWEEGKAPSTLTTRQGLDLTVKEGSRAPGEGGLAGRTEVPCVFSCQDRHRLDVAPPSPRHHIPSLLVSSPHPRSSQSSPLFPSVGKSAPDSSYPSRPVAPSNTAAPADPSDRGVASRPETRPIPFSTVNQTKRRATRSDSCSEFAKRASNRPLPIVPSRPEPSFTGPPANR